MMANQPYLPALIGLLGVLTGLLVNVGLELRRGRRERRARFAVDQLETYLAVAELAASLNAYRERPPARAGNHSELEPWVERELDDPLVELARLRLLGGNEED